MVVLQGVGYRRGALGDTEPRDVARGGGVFFARYVSRCRLPVVTNGGVVLIAFYSSISPCLSLSLLLFSVLAYLVLKETCLVRWSPRVRLRGPEPARDLPLLARSRRARLCQLSACLLLRPSTMGSQSSAPLKISLFPSPRNIPFSLTHFNSYNEPYRKS